MNPEFQLHVLSKRNILLFAGALTLSAGWSLSVPALVAMGESLFALLFVCWFASRRLFEGLEVRRRHHPHAFEGATLELELTCRNNSPFTLYMLELTDEFPPGENFFFRNMITDPFEPERDLILRYRAVCTRRRGLYLIGPVRLTGADPLGVFERRRTVEHVTPLYVLPNSQAVEGMDLLSEGTMQHIGEQVVQRVGASESFIHLREYRRGDHPRQIHWPTSARRNTLIVKEFEDNVMTDVSLVLDLRQIAQRGVGDLTSTELTIKAAACVAQTALAQAHRVQVFRIGEGVEHLPVSEGEAHLFYLLDRMAVWRAEGASDLGQAIAKRLCHIRPGSTLVWIVAASVFDTEWLEPLIPHLLHDGVKIIVIFVDDRTFHKVFKEQERFHHDGAPLEELVERFKLQGCTVYTLGREDNPTQKLATPR